MDTHQPTIDVEGLHRALTRRVRGEIGFGPGDRALYATDASNYRQVPIGLVVPVSVDDIIETVRICREFGAPVLHRGGGTSLAGQCCNEAVVIDSTRYCNRVLGIDAESRVGMVEPGTVLDDLRNAAREHGLTFGPDPSTHNHCTLGGMIGNNSAGVHSVMAGTTSENVQELDILTYDGLRMTVGPTPPDELERIIAEGGRRGEIYRALRDLRDRYADLIRERFPRIPRRVSGYNLDQLLPEHGFNVARALVGSEGTCVSILHATLNLVPQPPHTVVLMLGFDDVCHAADCVPRMREHGPIGIEGIDDRLVANMRKKCLYQRDVELLPDGSSWMLVEFGGPTLEEARDAACRALDDLQGNRWLRDSTLITGKEDQERMWRVREAGLGATAWVPGDDPDTWPGWEDSAVPPAELGNYLRDLYALYDKYGYKGAMYGHFGDGLVHTRITFGLHTSEDIDRFRKFLNDAAELVVRYNGSLSGEHGDGQARADLLPIMFGREIVRAFEEFKAIWDPDNRMNPGKLVHPQPAEVNLRIGPRFHPPRLDTVFDYPEDGGSFSHAVMRCVGVGECRRKQGGTMCPSFRATHDERHSTRGRARLLQEMLQGDPIKDRWQSEAVREALDLCLSCKGCKGDCPVSVDMATYKAEFLHHHYQGRRRPRAAYFMGMIHRWARLAFYAPWVPNFVTGLPGLGRISREIAGIHPNRPVPKFVGRPFRQDFDIVENPGRPTVVLWTDTFSNYFEPEPLHAAAEVLSAVGYHVEIPRRDLCCGRPLYEFGLLDDARKLLRQCMTGLKPHLDAGAYVVGIEPSCIATFRDELHALFPNDAEADRLRQRALMLPEFLQKVAKAELPQIGGKAVYHGHCFQKALLGMDCEDAVMKGCGMEARLLDDGCCGMAGGFGYEVDKYEVSVKIAEQGLLPAVRQAHPEARVIVDGFSCRAQLHQLHGLRAPSLAEVLRDGFRAQFTTQGDSS